jgi:4-amino-4-deoxy-L-arabinose transferase-like glycosyltransferase
MACIGSSVPPRRAECVTQEFENDVIPYWLQSTLAATPALFWMFLGTGLPWALAMLPRRDWSQKALVACLTIIFGPMLLTAWMFVLGLPQEAQLLRLETTLLGSAIIAGAGWLWVWRKWRTDFETSSNSRTAWAWDERLLIGLIAIALFIRWIGVAYWPSTAYDALWVYAYQGKLYALVNHIPDTIGYYPQFLQLQHTYLHLAVGGIDDHAARAVLPWLHVGSILAAYALGKQLFNRRVGLFTAGIWALYHHLGEWSRFGDLEVPVTLMFTSAATFFLLAWTDSHLNNRFLRRRYALIAGILLGAGMWTKPTMGAFIWGVLLMAGAAVILTVRAMERPLSVNRLLTALRPRLEVLLITGIACLPLGAVWYVRNLLLGHPPLVLPDGFWQSLAARSGTELGWPLLAVGLACGWVLWQARHGAHSTLRYKWLIGGIVLIVLGVAPSIYGTGRIDIGSNRMGFRDWLLTSTGVLLVGWTLWQVIHARWTSAQWTQGHTVGWAMLLTLPYFITWFYSYSYHYRLSFAIVPLLILPSAVLLNHIIQWRPRAGWLPKLAWGVSMVALAVPGILNPLYDVNAGWDWLWSDAMPDDHARLSSGNQALMRVVDGLQVYIDEQDTPLRVVAPGIRRLPFFFPTEDIQVEGLPTRLNELEGVTYFIYGKPETGGDFNTIPPGSNQVLNALALATTNPDDDRAPLRLAWGYDDGVFKYNVYELRLVNRFREPYVHAPVLEGEITFGGFARLLGHDIGGLEFWPERRLIMHVYWQVLDSAEADYMTFIQLRDAEGTIWSSWDGPVTDSHDGNYYSTLVWEPGEYVTDGRELQLNMPDVPEGSGYQIHIGLYNLVSGERVPILIDGEAAGDSYLLQRNITIVPTPP